MYNNIHQCFLVDLGVNDEGSYVCVAQNQFGTTQMAAYLTITGIGKCLH